MAAEKYRTGVKKTAGNAKRPGQAVKKSAPNPRKKPSSEEQARLAKRREAEKRRREERARAAALRRERRKRLFRLSFVLSLVFVVLYWVFVAVSIIARPDGSEDALPLMLFTEGERKEDKTLPPEEVCIGGVKYLSLKEFEPYLAVSQFGDYTTRSFLLPQSGEYATFYVGTPEAIINGNRVSMKEPALLIDDVLYLPLDFFSKMTCFSYSENVSAYGADVLTFLSAQPGFLFRPDTPSDPVDFATVPVAPTLPAETPEA